jgi:hypothetical protein
VPRRSLALLEKLRQRIRRATAWDGLAWIGVLLVVAGIVSFGLDYSLQLPRAVRGFFALSGLVGAVIVVLRWLVSPLARRVSDEDLAMLVEETHPGMRQTLLTAVQLCQPESVGGRYVSRELLDSVVEEVESHVGDIAPGRVLRLGRLRRNVLILFGLTLAVLVGGAFRPELAKVWFKRNLLLSADPWPKSTILELDPATPLVVAMGDDLPISVRVLRGDPRNVTIEWELADSEERASNMDRHENASRDVYIEEVGPHAKKVGAVVERFGLLDGLAREAIREGGGRIAHSLKTRELDGLEQALREAGAVIRVQTFDVFVHEFRNVSQPFRFWVQGGDDRIGGYDGYDVEVRLRPRIDMNSIELSYQLPEYTGASRERILQRHGNIKVPNGTRVEYRMATNIPVSRAYLILSKTVENDESSAGGDRDQWPNPGAIELDLEERRRFTGEFVVKKSGFYYFQFEDESGFRSVQPERFRVQAIEDRKPRVRIVKPSRSSEEVSPMAEIAIEIVVKDDYPVRNVILEGRYTPAKTQKRIPSSVRLLGSPSGDPSDSESDPKLEPYILKIADLAMLVGANGKKPTPGARFEFFVRAEDFGHTDQMITNADGTSRRRGNLGTSQARVLHIVDANYLEEEFTRETMIFRDIAHRIVSKQESVRKDLTESYESLLAKEKFDADDGARLARHRQDQHRVTESLESLSSQMGQLLEKMEANKVGEEKWKDWIRGLRRELDEIASQESEGVVSRLDNLRKEAQNANPQVAELLPITERQRDIERNVSSIVVRMSEFGDLRGLIQLMREVKQRQSDVRHGTSQLVNPDGGSSKKGAAEE